MSICVTCTKTGLVQGFTSKEQLEERVHDLLWKVIRANQAADPVHAPNETLEVVKSLAGGPSVEWKALPDGDNWAFENAGQVSFDYRSYNGTYYFGFGDSLFLTQWTESGDGSIWAYGEADDSIESVAVVQSFLEKGSARQEDVGALSHVPARLYVYATTGGRR